MKDRPKRLRGRVRAIRTYSLDTEIVKVIEQVAHTQRRTYGSVIEMAIAMLDKALTAQDELTPKPINGNQIKRVQEPVGQ